MLLKVLNYNGNCDVLGQLFKIKGPKFERIVSKLVTLLSGHLYELLVSKISRDFDIKELRDPIQPFSNYPEEL